MQVLNRIAAGFGLLVVVGMLVAWGLSTTRPATWSVEQRRVLEAEPDVVAEWVAFPVRWPEWIHGVEGAGAEWAPFGPPSGVGAGQAWRSSRSEGRMEVVAATPTSLEYRLTLPAGTTVATGSLRWSRVDRGTEVVWTDAGDYTGKPFAGLWVGPMARRVELQMKAALRMLADRLASAP